jgi:hypothetical protein
MKFKPGGGGYRIIPREGKEDLGYTNRLLAGVAALYGIFL